MDLAPFAPRFAPNGMVCAVDHLAAGAGVAILRSGGSAVDAAVATSAVLAVTCQHLCGMGGDLWAIVHPGAGAGAGGVAALNASGRAGSGADPDRLRAQGYRAIPTSGHIAAVPVPGCVDGWVALHGRFGRLSLAEVLEPARAYAADGFPASQTLAASAPRVAHLADAGDYIQGGEPLLPGRRVRRPGLARALSEVAAGGRDAFYRGEFGEGLLALGGGEYVEADVARSQADWVTPLQVEAWGKQLWTVPPNSQGYLTLAAAWMAAGLDLPGDPDDPGWAHLLVEAARQAGQDRLAVLHEGADGQALLAPERLGPRRDAIDPGRAGFLGPLPVAGDTIALCAADSSGQGVTLVQSNASGWGCGLIVPGVRIFLHNRGLGFSLVPGHPAEYGPGRRPPHTLSPTLVTDPGGGLRMVVGTMGGDSQPQILLQVLARVLQAGQGPATAIAAGRWALAPDDRGGNGNAQGEAGGSIGFSTWSGQGRVTVRLEGHAPEAWQAGLAERGHRVAWDDAWSHAFGHAQLIMMEADHLIGAADPRPLSGAAAGW